MIDVAGVAFSVAVASAGLAALAPLGLPAHLTHPDAIDLALVLPRWDLSRWEGLRLGAVASAAAIAIPAGAWPLAIAVAFVPSLALHVRGARARERAAAGSVDVLHGTHAAMRGGMPLARALRLALDRVEPEVRRPFDEALRSFELNASFADAVRSVRERVRDRRVALALDALALVASEQLPAPKGAAVIASVADRLTFEGRLLDEIRARTSGVRAQIVILALLVPAIATYLAATMPGLGTTLASPLGRYLLIPIALVFEIVGVVASRSIVRGLAR